MRERELASACDRCLTCGLRLVFGRFVGNSSDAMRVPKKLPARLVVMDKHPLPPGELMITAGNRDTMIDYVAALPASVM